MCNLNSQICVETTTCTYFNFQSIVKWSTISWNLHPDICIVVFFFRRDRHPANGILNTTWLTYTAHFAHSRNMKKVSLNPIIRHFQNANHYYTFQTTTSKSTARAGSSSTPRLNISCQNVIINMHAPATAPPATKKTNSAKSTLEKSVVAPPVPKRTAIKPAPNPKSTKSQSSAPRARIPDLTSMQIASPRRSQQRQQRGQHQQPPISVPMQIDQHRHQQLMPHMSNVTTQRSSVFSEPARYDAATSSSQSSFLQRSSMLGLERYHPYTVNGDVVQFSRRTDYYSSHTFFGDGYM